MKTRTAFLFGSLSLVLAACSGSSSPDPVGGNDPDPVAQGLLSPVTNTAAFEQSIKDGLARMTSSDVLARADAAATASYTGTYTQELDVDEADSVRYDGERLIVAPRRFSGCCFILDAAFAPPDGLPVPGAIRILETDPVLATAQLISEIELDIGESVQGMYQVDDTLFALTAEHFYGSYGQFWADIAVWAPEKLGFEVYDLSDTANPELKLEAEIEGVFVASRRVEDTIYVVTRHTPTIDGLHYYVTTEQQRLENEELLQSATLEDLMPKVTIAGETRLLAQPENCYVTTTDDTTNNPILTSITAIPVNDPENFTTACYNESAYGSYVSHDSFYLTELRPNTSLQRDITRIHKFGLAGTTIDYRGSADIEGTVWQGNQSDFRLSEQGGDLRVLSSQFDWNSEDFVDHYLYVLRESQTTPDLEIISNLPNDARPEEIGQPNEPLFGVRFLENRAYAVTAERIDPLYVIDLTDPEDPYIAGELHVPGVSDFLHPVTENLLLGLGRDAGGGVKVELFDASDISLPVSRGTHVIGGSGSYSEAVFNRHAFTYQADVDGVDRFIVPVNAFASDGSYTFLGSALHLFEIQNKLTPALTMMNQVGTVQPLSSGGEPEWIERSRAYLHDNAIFYVRDEDVWGSFWSVPSTTNGPF
jgi:uncharacterized secreted protein with C-terminal beta-propeller domain